MEKSIKITNGKPPELTGQWTIGEVLAAADFLRRWIEGQQIAAPTQEPQKAARKES